MATQTYNYTCVLTGTDGTDVVYTATAKGTTAAIALFNAQVLLTGFINQDCLEDGCEDLCAKLTPAEVMDYVCGMGFTVEVKITFG